MGWASFHPPLGTGGNDQIDDIGNAGNDDHAHGQRCAKAGVLQRIATDLRIEQDWHDVER